MNADTYLGYLQSHVKCNGFRIHMESISIDLRHLMVAPSPYRSGTLGSVPNMGDVSH